MMGTMRFVNAILPFVISVGCGNNPCEMLASAERAVVAVRAAGAPQFLADEFVAFEATLAQVERELGRQQQKSVLLRDYSSVAQDVVSMQAEASRLIAAAAEKKQRAKALVVDALERARQSVRDAHALASGTAHLALRGSADTVKDYCRMMMDSLDRVEGIIAAGDYNAAMLKIEVIEEAGHLLTRAINAASLALDGRPGKTAVHRAAGSATTGRVLTTYARSMAARGPRSADGG